MRLRTATQLARAVRITALCLSIGSSMAQAALAADPGAGVDEANAGGRVFVLGVDGGSWNVIDAMRAENQLPRLSELMARGATARLEAVEPVNSPVVWTSIATGRSPEATGVTDFFGTRLMVRVPSVYERLAADGVRVGLYDVLMTWPPQLFPGGFVIPGWLRRDESVTPADVWDRVGFDPYVNDYDRMRTTGDYLEGSRREVSLKPERFLALVDAFDLQVGATTIYSPDMTSHRFWHAAHPEAFDGDGSDAPAEEREAIRNAYLGFDAAAGRLADSLAPEDVLIIVSDHGFRAREDGIRNVWVSHVAENLKAAGFDPARDGFSVLSAFGSVSLRVHPGSDDSLETVRERDALVERLIAHLHSYRDADGESLYSAVEFLDGNGRPDTVPRSWLNQLRQWVVRKVLWLVFDVQSSDGSHAIVFGLPSDARLAPLWPDGEVEVAGRRLPVSTAFSRQRFSGDHDPFGIFIAAGGPIAARSERGDVSVLDVAPLLFHLTHRGVPDDLEGRVPVELLKPEVLDARPLIRVAADTYPGLPTPDSSSRGGDEPGDELIEKLRALGYVE